MVGAVDVAARLLERRMVATSNRFDALSEDDDVIPIMSVDRQSTTRKSAVEFHMA